MRCHCALLPLEGDRAANSLLRRFGRLDVQQPIAEILVAALRTKIPGGGGQRLFDVVGDYLEERKER